MSQLTVGEVSWERLCLEGIEALVEAHRRELAMSSLPLAFDHELICRLEEQNVLVAIAAHRDGVLIGYAFWTLSPSVETRGITVAAQGPLFVAPAERKSRAFVMLWRKSMRVLKERGCRLAYAHAAIGSPSGLSRFLASQGRETYRVWEIDLSAEGAQRSE